MFLKEYKALYIIRKNCESKPFEKLKRHLSEYKSCHLSENKTFDFTSPKTSIIRINLDVQKTITNLDEIQFSIV